MIFVGKNRLAGTGGKSRRRQRAARPQRRGVAVVKDRGGKDGGGSAVADSGDKVGETAGASGGDDRHRDRGGHRAQKRNVKAAAGAVAVKGGEENLARAESGRMTRPGDGFALGGSAAAVGEGVPLVGGVGAAARVNRDDHALRAEAQGALLYEFGTGERGRIDRNLVGAGVEEFAHVFGGADASAGGEGDEALRRDLAENVYKRVAPVVCGGDVEEGDFVGAVLCVEAGDFGGVSGVAEVLELDAFDDSAVVNVKAGDDSDGGAGRCGFHGDIFTAKRRRGKRPIKNWPLALVNEEQSLALVGV